MKTSERKREFGCRIETESWTFLKEKHLSKFREWGEKNP